MIDKPTALSVSEKERALLQSFFKDNEGLLQAIRAIFFGLEVTAEERKLVTETFKNEELLSIFYRRFVPTISKNTAIGEVQDIWLGAEQMVFGQNPNSIKQAIEYKRIAVDYTREGLKRLVDETEPPIDISYNPLQHPQDELGIVLLARNQYIRHIEMQLLTLKLIANTATKTEEEVEKRRMKDSVE